jgi:hypothetical protein
MEAKKVDKQSIQEASEEAKKRPMDFSPVERAKYIREMIANITIWIAQGDSEEIIKFRCPDFVESYPELFKKIINREDLSPIRVMLASLDKMGEGKLSQHDASIIVGKTLVEKFVKPSLRK